MLRDYGSPKGERTLLCENMFSCGWPYGGGTDEAPAEGRDTCVKMMATRTTNQLRPQYVFWQYREIPMKVMITTTNQKRISMVLRIWYALRLRQRWSLVQYVIVSWYESTTNVFTPCHHRTSHSQLPYVQGSLEVQPTITIPSVSDLVTGIPLGLIATRAPVRLIMMMTSII